MQVRYFTMYPGKFGQNSPTGSEDRVPERSYVNRIRTKTNPHFGWGGGGGILSWGGGVDGIKKTTDYKHGKLPSMKRAKIKRHFSSKFCYSPVKIISATILF